MTSVEIEAVESEAPSLVCLEACNIALAQNFHKSNVLMKKFLKRQATVYESRHDSDLKFLILTQVIAYLAHTGAVHPRSEPPNPRSHVLGKRKLGSES